MKEEINITREQFFNFVKGPEDTKQRISPATQHYLDYFDHYQKTGKKGNWNWAALGTLGWFFYRRMYVYGIILLVISWLIKKTFYFFNQISPGITLDTISIVVALGTFFLFVRYGDYVYLDHAKNKVAHGVLKGGINRIVGIPYAIYCWIVPPALFIFSILVEGGITQVFPPSLQYEMGVMRFYGDLSFLADKTEAARWYRAAAEQENMEAQLFLAQMYYLGEGVEKNLEKSFQWFLKAAEQGSSKAQRMVGGIYLTGKGIEQNNAEAVKWLEKAAEQGDALSQYAVAQMYDKGEGMAHEDKKKALGWYLKAAEQGLEKAQAVVADMYYFGEGIPQADKQKAFEWSLKAAEQGNISAQYNLGQMYSSGAGMSHPDKKKAVEWYEKAADNGHEKAQSNLAYLYCKREAVPHDYKKSAIWLLKKGGVRFEKLKEDLLDEKMYSAYKNYEKECELIQAAAEKGEPLAQYIFALMFYKGIGVEKDYDKSVEWFKKAATNGNYDADVALSVLYGRDENLLEKDKKVFECLLNALSLYCADSSYILAFLEKANSTNANNPEKNTASALVAKGIDCFHKHQDNEAFKFVNDAASKSYSIAEYLLAKMYEGGYGCRKDSKRYISLLEKAAERGLAPAQFDLGRAFITGKEFSHDYKQARTWIKQAADQGYKPAQQLLGVQIQ